MRYGPQIAMSAVLGTMSLFGALILQKRWMRWLALSLGVMEFAMLAALLVVIGKYR